MGIENWEHFFKAETRTSGRSLFLKGKMVIQQPSDTEIVAFVRVSPPLKVSLKSASVSSKTVIADCNCPAGKKGLFCKHIWAALLATAEKNSDFFDSKTEIEKVSPQANKAEKSPPTENSKAREQAQADFKEKQNLYRKIQYQKQKLRQQEFKLKKTKTVEVEYPRDVDRALTYFTTNGIELRTCLNKEAISSAKKSLARVFHPDFGGSHHEIIELNKYAAILENYIKIQPGVGS